MSQELKSVGQGKRGRFRFRFFSSKVGSKSGFFVGQIRIRFFVGQIRIRVNRAGPATLCFLAKIFILWGRNYVFIIVGWRKSILSDIFGMKSFKGTVHLFYIGGVFSIFSINVVAMVDLLVSRIGPKWSNGNWTGLWHHNIDHSGHRDK